MQAEAVVPSTVIVAEQPAVRNHSLRGEVLPCLALAAVALVLACVALWPLPMFAATHLVNLYDPLDSTWRMWVTNHNLLDPGNFTQAPIAYPYRDTMFFDELILGEALIAAPILASTGNPILGYNFVMFLTFPLSAVAVYLLTFHMSRSRIAGFGAGLVYAFSAYHFMRVTQLGLANIQWLPLLLLAFDKLLRSRGRSVGWAVALAALLVVQALSAQYYFFYMIILLASYFLYALARRVTRPLFTRRLWLTLVGMGVGAALPVLPFYLNFLQVKNRWAFDTDSDIALYSANFQTIFAAPASAPWLKNLLSPFFADGWTDRERSLFPGFVPLVLLVVAAVAWLYNRRKVQLEVGEHPAPNPVGRYYVPYLLLLFFGSLILCFGPYLQVTYDNQTTIPLPYWLLYNFVPGMDGLHGIARIWVLGTLAYSVLAGYGLLAIYNVVKARGMRREARAQERINPAATTGYAALILPALLLGFALFEQIGPPYPHNVAPAVDDPPGYVSYLAGQPDGALLNFPTLRQKDSRSAYVNNIYQHYTIMHHKPVVNAPPNSVHPSGYRKLNADLRDRFPDAETLDILRGIGVRYLAFHLPLLNERQQNRIFRHQAELAPHMQWQAAFNGEDQPVSEADSQRGVAEVLIYTIQPISQSITRLPQYVPAGSKVYLSESDPLTRTAYMGAAAYVLANTGADLYGYDYASFGPSVRKANLTSYDYWLLWRDEPLPAGSSQVWANEWVTLYRRNQ